MSQSSSVIAPETERSRTRPLEKDDGKVIDLMDALRRSLAGKGGGSKEGAECFLERKNGKAVAKATLKAKKRTV